MCDVAERSSHASLRKVSPLPGSSPIERRPTRGVATPNRRCAYTEPMTANCTSQSACTSALAPASRSTVGVPPGTGTGVAIAGRATPVMRPMRNNALAIVAPVLPAEIIALALPSRTASAARTNVESRLVRTLLAGSSSIAMTSLATISGRPPVPSRPSGPTSTTGIPASAA